MQRVATYMTVKPGMEEAYREEHRHVWPEVLAGISRHGIANYSIFMTGRALFSFFEVDDLDKAMGLAAADPINQKWQEHMASLMDIASGVKDGSTVYLQEVFRADGYAGAVSAVQRVATFMRVKAGMEERYREEHDNIWPEILQQIEQARVRNYSIFMRGRELYSYFEVEDLERAMTMLAADPINQRWQQHMAPLMDVGSGVKDGSTAYLEEVFHFD
jgi:L-rhamnose mutarotase